MVSESTPESQEARLEEVREATSKLNALIHWLTLPERVREAVEEAFPAFSDDDLGRRIGKDTEIVAKWRLQAVLLAKVFDMIKVRKEQAYPGPLTSNTDLVEAVMQLNRGASSSILAKAIGHSISEATIRRWARLRAGQIEVRYFTKAGGESPSPDPL